MIARKHDNRKILNRKKWSRAKEEIELPSHNAYNNDDDDDNEEWRRGGEREEMCQGIEEHRKVLKHRKNVTQNQKKNSNPRQSFFLLKGKKVLNSPLEAITIRHRKC